MLLWQKALNLLLRRRSVDMKTAVFISFRLFGETRGNAFRQLKLTAFPVKASPEL